MNRVLILTAKNTETAAVKEQLLGPVKSGRTARGNRFNIWHLRSSADREVPIDQIEVALYETGRGQSAAIVSTTHLAESFRPDLVVYLGCAGGDPHETTVGDVVVATEVWNYERGNAGAGDQVRLKGHPIEPDRVLVDECKSIDEFGSWRHRIPSGARNNVTVHFQPVASGEKVIKSERSEIWTAIKKSLSDEIIACETEGHGFLTSLVPLKTYGIMIRGISDTLDDKGASGKASDDLKQREATSHAAALCAAVIEGLDYQALRSVKGTETISNDRSEIVSLEVMAEISRLPEILKTLISVLGDEQVTIRKVSEGSILLVAEMAMKPAALAAALFDGGLLSRLLGHQVRQCVSSIRTSGDREFDSWLEWVRKGNVGGGTEALASKENQRWRHLAADLGRDLEKVGEQWGRRGWRFMAAPSFRDSMRTARVTQRDLAALAGYSASNMSRILSGKPVAEITARRTYEALRQRLRGDLPSFEQLFAPA